MGNVNDSIARMKQLALYRGINEDENRQSNYTLCEHTKAADGKVYGIVKECNRYYIKYTTPEKATIAESYQYVSGFSNKKRDEFSNHNAAVNFFDQKINSINEACDSEARVKSLDPFKREVVIEEGKEAFANELARQRQIMYNAAMLLGESKDFVPVKEKGCTTAQPEAETGEKGDKMKGSKEVTPDMGYKGSKTSGVKVDGGMPDAKTVKEGCECGCKDGSCHCKDTDFDNGVDKGRDPKKIGWDMEGQTKVNEEADEKFSEGLPSSAGVGEADTDHNNDPFNKSVNEGEEDFDAEDVESPEIESDEDAEFDADLEGEEGIEDELDDEDLEGDEDLDIADDFDSDIDDLDSDIDDMEDIEAEGEVDETDPDSIRAEIERLQGLLDGMENDELGDEELEGEESIDDEEGDELVGDELGGDDDFEGEDYVDDFDDEEGVDECGNGACMSEYDFDDEDEDSPLNQFLNDPANQLPSEKELRKGRRAAAADMGDGVDESKRAIMNSIVESVVRQFVNEDELHVFGKHPGYRKKPMELPTTGSDNTEHGRDWNDDSCHTEEPFGKQIGNGDPFNHLVDAVTKDVMYQLKKGIPIEGEK